MTAAGVAWIYELQGCQGQSLTRCVNGQTMESCDSYFQEEQRFNNAMLGWMTSSWSTKDLVSLSIATTEKEKAKKENGDLNTVWRREARG